MEIVIGCQDRVQCKYNATVTSKWQFTAGEASWFATSQHTMSGIDNANVMAAGAERSRKSLYWELRRKPTAKTTDYGTLYGGIPAPAQSEFQIGM